MTRSTIVLGLFILALGAGSAWLFSGDDEKAGRRGNWGGRSITVKVDPVKNREFADIVEAIGNARARESVILTAPVSDIVSKIYFTSGQVVKKGQRLVDLNSQEEQAQLREAKANVVEAKKQFARVSNLVKQGNASKASQETSQRRLSEANYRLQAIEARLKDRSVVAPFDGVLGLRQISEGSLINSNTPITTIDAIDRIDLDFSVPERFINILKRGQTVEAKVEAYDGQTFEGRVQSVDSRIDPVTRTVTVRAEINNDDLKLRPGMLMTVELIARRWQAPYVGEESVLSMSGNQYVYVVGADNQAERRPVTLGLRRAGYVEVKSGITLGDRVVTEGLLRLGRGGSKVSVYGEKPAQSVRGQRGGKKRGKPSKDGKKSSAKQGG